jgi:hypothetical protein
LPHFTVLALGAVGAGAIACVLLAVLPSHWIFGAYFGAQVFQQTWTLSDVRLGSVDLALGVLGVSLLVHGLPRAPRGAVPHLFLWVALAALLTMSYAVSPSGEAYMSGLVGSTYQIYRYALRLVLIYPVTCLLVDTGPKFDDVLTCIVLSTVVFACMAIVQGYGGQGATGPFVTKNGLGAALAVGMVLVFIDVLSAHRWVLAALATPILLRGLLFASSRGAFAGTATGIAVACGVLYLARVRMRLATLVVAGVAAVIVGFVLRPDLLARESVLRVFTTVDLQQDNFVWRMQERWPLFTKRALQRPWLGWGEAIDESLGTSALTAHNGYISLAVTSGIPVVALVLVFAALAGGDVLRLVGRTKDPDDYVRAAKIAGGLTCLLTHNVVDAVIVTPFVGGAMWMLMASAGVLARNAVRDDAPTPPAAGLV